MFNKQASPTSTPKFTYTTMGDLAPDEPWMILPYGPSGAGKTWFLGTAAPRLLIVNIGDGLVTLKSPLFRSLYPGIKDVIVVDLNERFEHGKVKKAEAFDLVCDVLDDALKTQRDKFDTIALDDASMLKFFALNKGIEMNDGMRNSKRELKRYVWSDVGDMGKEMEIIKWFLTEYIPIFKNAGVNFILTAHERLLYGKAPKIGEEAPLKAIKPGFTGKTFPDEVPRFFDEVWHLELKTGGNQQFSRATVHSNSLVQCKTRHNGIFRATEDNPNFLRMLERIRKGELHQSYQPK